MPDACIGRLTNPQMIGLKAGSMDDPILSGRLANDTRYEVRDTDLRVVDRSGTTITRIAIDDITAIQRGGTDLVITLSQRDPLSLTFAELNDAQVVAERLRGLVANEATLAMRGWRYRRMRRRWWNRRSQREA